MKAARLVILGIAVAAGGLAAYLAGTFESAPPPPVAQIPTVDILVAKNDLNMGMTLSEQDLDWQTWPESAAQNPAFIRKSERPDAQQKLGGAIVRVSMAQGEPIRENKLIIGKTSGYMAAILPAGMRAFSTEVSAESGAGGFILPNDRVDVIFSRRDDPDRPVRGMAYSDTILRDVRVLAIDQFVQEKDGQRVVVGKTATLELTQRQAEILATARQRGMLSLSLRSIVDAGTKPETVTEGGNRLDTVRFGVSSSSLSQ